MIEYWKHYTITTEIKDGKTEVTYEPAMTYEDGQEYIREQLVKKFLADPAAKERYNEMARMNNLPEWTD